MTILTTLIHANDASGLRVHQEFIRRYGSDSGLLVDMNALICAPFWSHHLDGKQKTKVKTRIRLAGNEEEQWWINTMVFNRMGRVMLPHVVQLTNNDREFAMLEWHALLLSWLESLPCRVVNPAGPQGLSGGEYSDVQWAFWARKAELPVRGFQVATNIRHMDALGKRECYRPEVVEDGIKLLNLELLKSHEVVASAPGGVCCFEQEVEDLVSVLVTGLSVIGDIPSKIRIGCLKLSLIIGCDLLQIWFAKGKHYDDWRFLSASTFPDFSRSEDLDAVVNYLGDQTGMREK